MNPQFIQTENRIAYLESVLIHKGKLLADATDKGLKHLIDLINEEIKAVQQDLKEELDLLEELTVKQIC